MLHNFFYYAQKGYAFKKNKMHKKRLHKYFYDAFPVFHSLSAVSQL